VKADWGVEVLLKAFLTSMIDGVMSFVFGRCSVLISAGAPPIQTEALRDIPQSLPSEVDYATTASFQILSN
jgi:hypothetical protein